MTEPIMALLLGEEKKATPIPSSISTPTIAAAEKRGVKKMKIPRLMPPSPMPKAESIPGSLRSEILPARGEKRAMQTGWASRISPAAWAVSPQMSCRYSDSMKVEAKMAL